MFWCRMKYLITYISLLIFSIASMAQETPPPGFPSADTLGVLRELVISATMKPISRESCTVPVEIYHSSYFSKNPTPNIFEALANVNGVRPQVNCNICNTGDIHINGLEGPYTMILIDGMPIVSALSTVYGLSGIPTSMIDRIEVVKGPASALYGSEAVGGLINVITKKVSEAPLLSLESTINSWGEWNNDVMFKVSPTKRLGVLSGINYFNYQQPRDDNDDGFTDVTLQDRWSIFQKWSLQRKSNKLLQWGARYVYEDRWGGELDWTPEFRGGDSIYGESIYTRRWEIIGNYELPFSKKILFSFSYNHHDQDSRYGTMSYIADQEVLFGQLTWDEQYKGHDLLTGIAYRFTRYDDNTPATEYVTDQRTINRESRIVLPGLFVQDEWTLNERNKMLLGYRIDKSNEHGWIHTPRIGYKWSRNMRSILRWNAGTGFRNVNVFAEDHAALTGARTVIIQEDLKPERSWNSNINWIQKFYGDRWRLTLDASVFYTHFTDRIFTDYESNVDQILYRNIAGYSYSRGGSLNLDLNISAWSLNAGITAMDVGIQEGELTTRPLLTERFSGTFALSYDWVKYHLKFDYTGNVYSPMLLPLAGSLDPRPGQSPWWSIQNIQVKWTGSKRWEIYGGVKNILDWTPWKHTPFLIARSNDPFDKEIEVNNPYQLSFDPTYVYGPNQGRRFFFGIRYTFLHS